MYDSYGVSRCRIIKMVPACTETISTKYLFVFSLSTWQGALHLCSDDWFWGGAWYQEVLRASHCTVFAGGFAWQTAYLLCKSDAYAHRQRQEWGSYSWYGLRTGSRPADADGDGQKRRSGVLIVGSSSLFCDVNDKQEYSSKKISSLSLLSVLSRRLRVNLFSAFPIKAKVNRFPINLFIVSSLCRCAK